MQKAGVDFAGLCFTPQGGIRSLDRRVIRKHRRRVWCLLIWLRVFGLHGVGLWFIRHFVALTFYYHYALSLGAIRAPVKSREGQYQGKCSENCVIWRDTVPDFTRIPGKRA